MRVFAYMRQCDICQRYKPELVKTPSLLQPLPETQSIFTYITMNFIEGLPKSNGKSMIIVMVDRLTKYAHFLLLLHPYTVAQLFLDNIYKLYGYPTTIVSDRDSFFE